MSSLIHKDSCVKSELDLFLIPPTQTYIEKEYFVKHYPLANIRDGVRVEFNISGNGEYYIHLSSSNLYAKVKIIKIDGADLADNESVVPVKLFLHALFSHADRVWLEGKSDKIIM